jgi:inner membrane protein
MPTAISHSLVAVVFGKIFSKSTGVKFWVLSIICAILPDIDVIMFSFGIPYEHMYGHRGFSHSILFALLISLIIVLVGFREIKQNSKLWWSVVVYFFLIGLSHDILDAITSGGQGVGFFIPFDSTRYFFPFRPIRVSPFSIIRFFGSEGQRILVSELVWIWIPAIILLFFIHFIKARGHSQVTK